MKSTIVFVVLFFTIVFLTENGSATEDHSKVDLARGYHPYYHDASWLTSLLVITLPLVILPYIAFLFLIYASPSPIHYHHIHPGHHHHRSSSGTSGTAASNTYTRALDSLTNKVYNSFTQQQQQ